MYPRAGSSRDFSCAPDVAGELASIPGDEPQLWVEVRRLELVVPEVLERLHVVTPVVGERLHMSLVKLARLLAVEIANGDALEVTRWSGLAREVDAPELEAADFAVAP